MAYVRGKPCVDGSSHPSGECVDCGACEPLCRVDAIYYEDDLPEELQPYLADASRQVAIGLWGGAAKLVHSVSVNFWTPLVAPSPAGTTCKERERH
jgi:ferredoxin